MSKRKKKIRIKKKNCLLLIIILFISIFTIGKISNHFKNNNKKENTIQKRETTPIKEEVKTEDEIKLEELNNIHKEIDYFNMGYVNRYISYKEKNPTLPIIQVIKDVNMQLDHNHYEDIIPAKNLNTEKILVNKYYYLKDDYVPNNLENLSTQYAISNMKMVKVAKEAFERMAKEAYKENLKIVAMSTYRSYNYQVNLWNKYAKQDGKEKADTYSGRAGHSEHQTGLAVDVYNEKENYTSFEKTKEFKWMQEHAHEYGFILRFPKEKEKETGYQYESWHYRYVGIDIATYIKENNISFEEYYATVIKDW